MPSLFTKFTGTATASTGFSAFGAGNYLFSAIGTHTGTTKLEVRSPGTTGNEYSPAMDVSTTTSATSNTHEGVTTADGLQYAVTYIPGTATTGVVFASLTPTRIGGN